jgi:quinolinate synthase
VTSSNAEAMVRKLREQGHRRVIFLPDEYLAGNVAREVGMQLIVGDTAEAPAEREAREVEEAIVGWGGRCEVHEKFTVEDIASVRRQFPDAVVLAHPECSPEVVARDFSGSTTAMIRYVENMKSGVISCSPSAAWATTSSRRIPTRRPCACAASAART